MFLVFFVIFYFACYRRSYDDDHNYKNTTEEISPFAVNGFEDFLLHHAETEIITRTWVI